MITKRIPRKKSLNIINNFFFEDELKIIDDYLDDLFKDNNVLFPASKESLYIKGDMFKHHVSKNFDDEIYDIIINKLKTSFPTLVPETIYLHWGLGGHIDWHIDNGQSAAVSIYLTKDWTKEDGGYFIYEKENNDLEIILPKMNMCIFQTGAIPHCTTPTYTPNKIRKSIQVFFKK
tara:strand:+ start:110 stop:637 length:528 start_codon:yes stop_codon:yes gene_type:complete